jgi:hypothetical protein
MRYLAHQTHADVVLPMRALAGARLNALAPWAASEDLKVLRNLRGGLSSRAPERACARPIGIDSVRVGHREVPVCEEPLHARPLGMVSLPPQQALHVGPSRAKPENPSTRQARAR